MNKIIENNGNYAILTVGIGKNDFLPIYVRQFFDTYITGVFEVMRVVKLGEEENDGNRQISIVFTFDTPLDPIQFQKYVFGCLDCDIIPFLTGCKISITSLAFSVSIPEQLKYIATKGDLGVMIYTDQVYPHIHQLMTDVFSMTEKEIDTAIDMIDLMGFFKVEGCLLEDNKTKFNYVMDKMKLKYELY